MGKREHQTKYNNQHSEYELFDFINAQYNQLATNQVWK